MKSDFFMSQEISNKVQETILKLENRIENQNELDILWCEIKSLLLNELNSLLDLPTSNSKRKNKQFEKSQRFWNENIESVKQKRSI